MKLSDQQLEIVESEEKYILVKAGAGAGKTEVLVNRIIRLLEKEPKLSIKDFAIITFTNNSTAEMKSRLLGAMFKKLHSTKDPVQKERFHYEMELIGRVQISTIHKFCNAILKFAGPFRFENKVYSPEFHISTTNINKVISVVLSQWMEELSQGSHPLLEIMPPHQIRRQIEYFYNQLRSKGIDIQEVVEKTEQALMWMQTDQKSNIKRTLKELVLRLDEEYRKQKVGRIDVDDLLEFTYLALKGFPRLLNQVKSLYKYIFVDEFQDTSFYQTEIIKLICGGSNSPSLFAVGDVKQSIYQFRGADLNSYQGFERWINDRGKVYHLRTNYRSRGEIVEFVNSIFLRLERNSKKPHVVYEPIEPYQTAKEQISHVVKWIPSHELGEKQAVAFFLQEVDPGTYNKYTILFRTNKSMLEYEQKLNQVGIPTKILGGGDFFKRPEIRYVFHILNWIMAPDDLIRKNEVLGIPWVNFDHEKLERLYKELKRVIPIYSVAQILEEIFKNKDLNIRGYLQHYNQIQTRANLEKLKELTRTKFIGEKIGLIEYVQWLGSMIQHNQDEEQAEILEEFNAVQLTTIHNAKGLEFDHVILVELERGLDHDLLNPTILFHPETGIEFSFRRYLEPTTITSDKYHERLAQYKEEYLAEETRILYVALTRAKQTLYLVGDRNAQRTKNKITYLSWILGNL
jgi:DNA helicase II / ATP-dependent DNA helicase PcrA